MGKKAAANHMTAEQVKMELHEIDTELASLNSRKTELEDRRKVLIAGAHNALLGFQEILSGTQRLATVKPDKNKKPINELQLPTRPHNCLKGMGFRYIEDLLGIRRDDLLKIENMGVKSVHEIINALEKKGYNADHLKH